MNIYSVKDIKSGTFQQPFFKPHNIQAIREFNLACQDEKSFLNKYPADFELWKIGEFDELTGEFKKDQNFLTSALFHKEKGTLDEFPTKN